MAGKLAILRAILRAILHGERDPQRLADWLLSCHIRTVVAQWLDLWRRCCPFYEFQIDLHAADATVWLSVKGWPGVKAYIPVDSPRLVAKLPK